MLASLKMNYEIPIVKCQKDIYGNLVGKKHVQCQNLKDSLNDSIEALPAVCSIEVKIQVASFDRFCL